jgi:hypothetical protein
MVVAETIAGLGAVKTAFDMAKALQSIHEATARDRAVIELQKEILAAQAAQFALLERAGDLEKEVATLKAWDADKERYKLVDLGAGILAFALKEGMENGEPAHNICTSCYQSGLKSILVSSTWSPGRCHVLVCNDCGWYAYLSGNASKEHKDLQPKPRRRV